MKKWIMDYLMPMEVIGPAFVDKVSGKTVWYCEMKGSGRVALAEAPFSFFRVPVPNMRNLD